MIVTVTSVAHSLHLYLHNMAILAELIYSDWAGLILDTPELNGSPFQLIIHRFGARSHLLCFNAEQEVVFLSATKH